MIVLDAMLGKLSRYLRLLGYDLIIIDSNMKDYEIVQKYSQYTLLTRDRELVRRMKNAIYVKSDRALEQIKEVIGLLPRPEHERFTICSICGSELRLIDDHVNLPAYVPRNADNIYFCDKCKKYYWSGSHIRNFLDSMEKIGIEIGN